MWEFKVGDEIKAKKTVSRFIKKGDIGIIKDFSQNEEDKDKGYYIGIGGIPSTTLYAEKYLIEEWFEKINEEG